MIVDAPMLCDVMPSITEERAAEIVPILNQVLIKYGIDTPQRLGAFLAQLAHESGEFKYFKEIWGPTRAQRRYEGTSLARKLGNKLRGDGFRYRGRGPIQITGRANYEFYGKLIGLDLVGSPELAESLQVGLELAGAYWSTKQLNKLADIGNFREITKVINGGYNGYRSRLKYWKIAKNSIKENQKNETVAKEYLATAVVDSSGSVPSVVNSPTTVGIQGAANPK